jgi:hypothetical protein
LGRPALKESEQSAATRINAMGDIYGCSAETLVGLAGESANHGLPGVSSIREILYPPLRRKAYLCSRRMMQLTLESLVVLNGLFEAGPSRRRCFLPDSCFSQIPERSSSVAITPRLRMMNPIQHKKCIEIRGYNFVENNKPMFSIPSYFHLV